VGLKFFERVGSEDKLYDFIVEAVPVKAIGPDMLQRGRKGGIIPTVLEPSGEYRCFSPYAVCPPAVAEPLKMY
jgi:hypothetical protein